MSYRFDRLNDFTVGLDDPYLEYKSTREEVKTRIHNGQMKLLFSEIQFLTYYYKGEKATVVYAGAGTTGQHIPTLINLFPDLNFHLYGEKYHKTLLEMEKEGRVKLYGFFDDKTAKQYVDQLVFFISDIRLPPAHSWEDMNRQTDETVKMQMEDDNAEVIKKDMEAQARWVEIINPIQSLLKFRLPFPRNNTPLSYKYLAGLVYRQQWGRLSTTECRLVPDKPLTYTDWDCLAHEGAMFHHNNIGRESARYSNPVTGKDLPLIISRNITNNYDSVASFYILMEYLQKILGNNPSNKQVVKLFLAILDAKESQYKMISTDKF